MHPRLHIPQRFFREVALHLIKNIASLPVKVPLILGIHGASGEGKTFQCEQVLAELGVRSFLVSGGQMESKDAGEPAHLIRTTYLKAGKSDEDGYWTPSAILINDVDVGIGSWGDNVQYTVNRQTVIGELMHLADYPHSVEGRTTRRIPIIVTGNDFSKLHAPLVRAGRMSAFAWQPSHDEKAHILTGVFDHLSHDDCISIIATLESHGAQAGGVNRALPIAFFSHLKSSLVDDSLWASIQAITPTKALRQLAGGASIDLNIRPTVDELIESGIRLLEAGLLVDHLKEETYNGSNLYRAANLRADQPSQGSDQERSSQGLEHKP